MHNKIYEISRTPISKAVRISRANFVNSHDDYADYIGDDVLECNRGIYIESFKRYPFLKVSLHEIMFTSTQDLYAFIDVWTDEIKERVAWLDSDTLFNTDGHVVQKMFERTHENIFDRYYIHNHNEYAGTAADFVEWCKGLTEGDKFYVGGIVDFHH